ncbi:MAG: aspartate aminotransferase family protein [Hyphomicrobiaceae bacterium]
MLSEASGQGFVAGHNSLARSGQTYERAKNVFPGGTTRVTTARQPAPIYAAEGQGAWLTDIDGNRYLDLNNNYTTLIHGHAFQPMIEAVERQLRSGTCFANPTEHEVLHAEMLCDRVPSIEKVRYVNTGTEAVMFAIKAARAITGRAKVAKFEGAYHGGYDWVEVSEDSTPDNWGDNAKPASVPFAKGTPAAVLDDVVIVPFNDLKTTTALLERYGDELACLVVDMVPARVGLIPPEPGYFEAIRDITKRHGIVLISDEVLNFRQSYHGAAARFGVEPDLVTLGKIIGGGLPIGAIGGRADLMSVFDSSAGDPPLPQGGTFSANPLSMVAGMASLTALDPSAFEHLERIGEKVRSGIADAVARRGLPIVVTGTASLFRIHIKPRIPKTYREAWPTPLETKMLKAMSQSLLSKGLIMPALTTSSLSTPMTDDDIDFLLAAIDEFFATDMAKRMIECDSTSLNRP